MADPTTLLSALIDRPTNADREAEVLALLRRVSTEELNTLLTKVDVHRLYDAMDNRAFGPDNRDALVDLLARERRPELSVQASAAVIYALSKGVTNRRDEEAIRDVFLGAGGDELTRLKNEVNARTDAHDLEGVLFHSVDSGELRDQILRHIALEASRVSIDATKIISDIDDTVVSSLHDRDYPRGTIYPGVLALFEALDNGPDDDPFSLGDLTFVTARPSDAFGLIEGETRDTLERAGIAQAAIITGSFLALHTHDAMAAQKMVNIQHYAKLFPEYKLVFLGDSGQGDVTVAEKMNAEMPEAVTACFIHDVVNTPDEERAAHAAQGIHFHDGYVGAAAKAFELGLISKAGLDHVVAEAAAGLSKVAFASPEQREAAMIQHSKDADTAGSL